MKVTIIGGGGRVGSCAAYALQLGGIVSEIQILDANRAMAEGEALTFARRRFRSGPADLRG
jgi:L-lactate dehydrogenase